MRRGISVLQITFTIVFVNAFKATLVKMAEVLRRLPLTETTTKAKKINK